MYENVHISGPNYGGDNEFGAPSGPPLALGGRLVRLSARATSGHTGNTQQL